MPHGRILRVSCLVVFLLACAQRGREVAPAPAPGGRDHHEYEAVDTIGSAPLPEPGAATEGLAGGEADIRSAAIDSRPEVESLSSVDSSASPAPALPPSKRARAKKDWVRKDAERVPRRPDSEEGRGKAKLDERLTRVEETPAGPPRHSRGSDRMAPVAAPAIKAGRHDDNKQYNRFLTFLANNSHMVVYPVDISERLVVRTLDKAGKSLHNCQVEFKSVSGQLLAKSTTYADGSTHFFPAADAPARDKDFTVRATCGSQTRNGQLSRTGRRDNELRFTFNRRLPANVPVDIAIVLDTTGSMQSQIDRLKKTLKAIHFQLTHLSAKPDIRFALVAYRDQGDDYVTRPYQFTRNVREFQQTLDALDADGGGDTPEDLQAGLQDAMKKLDWRRDAVRVGFIVADAIPHTDYGQAYTYRSAMREALERGIKWISVGAGGLPREGEVIFRQIAQLTLGEYVFITQSGAGDHEGGAGEASHHVGSNYSTENLDQAIVRIVRRELSYLTDAPQDFDDTIVATAKPGLPRDTVLAPAVAEALRQLVDYSSIKLGDGTPVAIVPTTVNQDTYKDVAGYITDQFVLSASRNRTLKVVERDMQAISDELKIQLSDLVDATKAVPFGTMLGAELLVASKLTITADGASLFAKLIRVETGEMLSVAKVDMTTTVINAS